MKRTTKKKLDTGRIILVTGIVIMTIFLIALCWVGVVIGSMAVLFYSLPYIITVGYSLLVINRLEVTSTIIKRMTLLASIFGSLSAIYLFISFIVMMHVF